MAELNDKLLEEVNGGTDILEDRTPTAPEAGTNKNAPGNNDTAVSTSVPIIEIK